MAKGLDYPLNGSTCYGSKIADRVPKLIAYHKYPHIGDIHTGDLKIGLFNILNNDIKLNLYYIL